MCVRNSTKYKADKYLMSKGREGKQEEAGHKVVQRMTKTRREEGSQTHSDLGARTQWRTGDSSREAPTRGTLSINPLQSRLFQMSVSVLPSLAPLGRSSRGPQRSRPLGRDHAVGRAWPTRGARWPENL